MKALTYITGAAVAAMIGMAATPKQTACEWAMEWIVCLG
jgi:hypothetical protein